MKFFLLFFLLNSQGNKISYQHIENTEAYEIRISYWFNMHHFLKHEAFLQSELDSSFVNVDLSKNAEAELTRALEYYKTALGDKDLRTDDYMSDFKIWVTAVGETPKEIPEKFKEHFDVLRSFSDTYQSYFWDVHEKICHEVLDKYLPIIKNTEKAYWKEVLNATRALILDDTIKVDVVFVGKATKRNPRNRPYTSIFPTRVVMNSFNYNEIEGEWLELLFHESAHALILSETGFVAGTIIDIADNMGVRIPRQLGHAYLFYMTGYFARELLEKEGISYPKMYMQNRQVFSRYHQSLKRLDLYLSKEETLASVTEKILTDLTK